MFDYVEKQVPRSAKHVRKWLIGTLNISVSLSTIRSILFSEHFRYKRMRRSVKHLRDQQMFELFQSELSILHQQEGEGKIDVYYFDETGINLKPVIPYGWQKIGKTHQLPSVPSKNITVIGFMNKQCDFHGFRFTGAATALTTIECFNRFAESITKKTIVILDNASIHKAKNVKEKMPEWKSKGLFLQFIPPYCPELNLIERLWKELKYEWINKTAYFNDLEQLSAYVDEVLSKIGSEYTINFC